ncbi:Fungal-trans domain-containing protein [Fusarium sp. LHS14.1]|nr:Fungal-trans domain-containing protein [Fusarium sp. LHS14.1]
MISSGSPNSSRRISRRPACTPCRVRKLACDRSEPVCKRCRKARTKLNCIYPSSTTPLGTSNSEPELVSGANAATEAWPRTVAKPLIDAASDSGYFGYTSHNNVFEETQLDLLLANGSTSQQDSSERTERNNQRVAFRELQSPIRESALFALRCLPVEQMALQKSSSDLKGWVNVATDRIIQSTHVTFKGLLQQGDGGLSALAEILCNNTRRPIKEESHDAEQWISQFCDKNLRWESIGLFWAGIARISDDVDSLRSHHVESLTQQVSPETARTCLGYCIELARTFTEGNEVLLDLCRRKSILDSIIDGDARKF